MIIKKYLFLFLTIGISYPAYAQSDFDSARDRRIIAKHKIKQIQCYWFRNPLKPMDSVLVDSMLFYKKGFCVKRYTNVYTYTYEYGAKARLIKETIKTKDNTDSKITMFGYDEKGNMTLAETVKKWEHIKQPNPDTVLRHFEYGSKKQVLNEYWTDLKGRILEKKRYKYITAGLDKDMLKIVQFYDEHNELTYIKQYYKNGLVRDYDVHNGKTTFVAESILNANHDLLKFTDYYHLDENDLRQVTRDGHGMIKKDTLTEVYKYNKFGFCSQMLSYKHNKLQEYRKWFFKQ